MNAQSRVEQARQIIRRALDEAPHATACASRVRSEACNCWRFQATMFLLDLGHDAVLDEAMLEAYRDSRPSREQGEHPL